MLNIVFKFSFGCQLTLSLNACIKPLNAGRSEHLTISAHDLSLSHSGAGFKYGLSNATPPVSKNRHSLSSIVPLQKYIGNDEQVAPLPVSDNACHARALRASL